MTDVELLGDPSVETRDGRNYIRFPPGGGVVHEVEYVIDHWCGGPVPVGNTERLISEIVRCLKPRLAAEIGVQFAHTTICMAHAMPPDGHVYGVDLVVRPVARRIIEMLGMSGRVTLIEGDSGAVIGDLPEGIEFAYIDGNHSWEFAKSDTDMLWPKLAEGAIVVYDDMNDRANASIPGPAFFVADRFPGGIYVPTDRGIGIVQKGPKTVRINGFGPDRQWNEAIVWP